MKSFSWVLLLCLHPNTQTLRRTKKLSNHPVDAVNLHKLNAERYMQQLSLEEKERERDINAVWFLMRYAVKNR